MSSPLAVNDLIQITYYNTLMSQQILTVLHARVKVVPTGGLTAEAQLDDLVNKISDKANFNFLDRYTKATATNMFFDRVTAQKIKPTRTIYASAEISEIGALTPVSGTANIAISIEKRSLNVSRSGIGRMQLCGFPADKILGGRVDPDFIAAELDDLKDSLAGSFTGGPLYAGTYQWCLPAGGADDTYDVFDCVVKDTARTMHRRTVGLGI